MLTQLQPQAWPFDPGSISYDGWRFWHMPVGIWLMYDRTGNYVRDLSGNGYHLTLDNLTWSLTTSGPAVQTEQAASDELGLDDKQIAIPAGTDLTYIWYGVLDSGMSFATGNPGWWRSDTTSQGDNCINIGGADYSTDNAPDIHWGGTVIMQPDDPLTQQFTHDVPTAQAFVIRDSTDVAWWENGMLKRYETHSSSATAQSIYRFGWQYTNATPGEHIAADWILHALYFRAWDDSEVIEWSANPLGPFTMSLMDFLVTGGVAPPPTGPCRIIGS